MEDLLQIAKEEGMDLTEGADLSPADVAVQMWLKAPRLLEEKHGERFFFTYKSLEYYHGHASSANGYQTPTEGSLHQLESDLGQWFEEKNRSSHVRVLMYLRDDEIHFLVRHGEPMKREGSLKRGEPESVCYRPEKHDVVVFVPAYNELRINASTKGIKELYQAEFGRCLFGDKDHFPAKANIRLDH